MYKYSFRAECIHDVLDYIAVVAEIAKVMSLTVFQDAMFPGCDVEIVTTLSLGELQLAESRVDDAHLIQETMQPMCQRKS